MTDITANRSGLSGILSQNFQGLVFGPALFVFGLAYLCDMPELHAQISNNPQGSGGVSSSQMSMLRSELQKRGITEEEAKRIAPYLDFTK